jgi:hypothetical protein
MNQFSIDSNIAERHNRFIWSLTICGKDDLEKFHKQIGFLHPKKAVKLQEALNSYVNYYWDIPETKDDIINFINLKGKPRVIRKEVRLLSIKKINLIKLYTKLKQFNIDSRILGPWKNNLGTEYYCLTLKMNDEEVKK